MLGWTEILILVALLVILFGRGKISELMGDVAKGIKSFKKGMADDPAEPKETVKTIDSNANQSAAGATHVPNQENTKVS